MTKAADLTVVQNRIIDPFYKEGEPQRVIVERAGCSQSAVSKHIQESYLEGKSVVGKGAQATGMTAVLKTLSSKAESRTWESFTRSGLRLESEHQEQHSQTLSRQRSLTWAKEKNWTIAKWSKVLFLDESKFCISFGNLGSGVWRKTGEDQNPSCLKSRVKFPQSDSLTRYAKIYPEVLKEVRFQRAYDRSLQSGQKGKVLVGFGLYRWETLQDLYQSKDKDKISYVNFLRTMKSTCDPKTKMDDAVKYILQRDQRQASAAKRKRVQSTRGRPAGASRAKWRT